MTLPTAHAAHALSRTRRLISGLRMARRQGWRGTCREFAEWYGLPISSTNNVATRKMLRKAFCRSRPPAVGPAKILHPGRFGYVRIGETLLRAAGISGPMVREIGDGWITIRGAK